MKDDALTKCPTTGDDVDRIISASAFHLKGTGWYTTDYKSSAASSPAASKTESTPDPAAGAKPACEGGAQSCGAAACEKPVS